MNLENTQSYDQKQIIKNTILFGDAFVVGVLD